MSGGSSRVLSIPPGVPFLASLADALLDGRLIPGFHGGAHPLALADVTVFVPTRRAARALRKIFAERLGGAAAILPVVRPLGDVDEDLAWFGMEGDQDTLADHWLKHADAGLVVITRGAEGATGYTRNLKVTVPSERVAVVDTIGAGDTFDAGILASLKRSNLLTKTQVASLGEQAVRDALALGAKAAAVTVSRAGANPPWAHEIGL